MASWITIGIVCLLSGVIILDKYSVAEFGISQPLVAASIIGFAFGSFYQGVLIGVLIQPLWLAGLPIGRRIPLDAQAAGISGAVCFFTIRLLGSAPIQTAALISIIIAALAGLWGGLLDRINRNLNRILASRLEKARNRLQVFGLHAAALEAGFIRGVLLALIAAGLGYLISVLSVLGSIPVVPISSLLVATLSIGLGGAWVMFGAKKQAIPVLAGFASWVIIWVLVRF